MQNVRIMRSAHNRQKVTAGFDHSARQGPVFQDMREVAADGCMLGAKTRAQSMATFTFLKRN